MGGGATIWSSKVGPNRKAFVFIVRPHSQVSHSSMDKSRLPFSPHVHILYGRCIDL